MTGHADVQNRAYNILTLLQQVRYFVAFRVIKGSESIFGCVTCASGCFSAYRRDRLLEVLPAWETQSFLGREATFGDDRALTNMLLRHSRVVYQSTARCATNVPHQFKGFLVQQTRWKKSWLRESLIASTFFWRKNPIASIPTYASNIFPIVAPIVIFHACIWNPIMHGADPWMYLVGLYAMAVLYSLYYGFTRRKPYWWAGIAFVLLYATVLIWQTYWAIATARKTAWGTRSGPRRRRARLPHHRHDRLAAAVGHPGLRRGRAHRRGRGRRQRARGGRVIDRKLPFNLVGRPARLGRRHPRDPRSRRCRSWPTRTTAQEGRLIALHVDRSSAARPSRASTAPTPRYVAANHLHYSNAVMVLNVHAVMDGDALRRREPRELRAARQAVRRRHADAARRRLPHGHARADHGLARRRARPARTTRCC